MRRTKPEPRVITADVRYNSVSVSFFINRIMHRGKKSVATTIVYDALDIIKEKTGKNPVEVMDSCFEKCRSHHGSPPTPCGWCNLPGSNGSSYQPPDDPGHALDH